MFLLFMILPLLFVFTSCTEEESIVEPSINEAEVLVQHLESTGDYLNTLLPAIMDVQAVRDLQLVNPAKLHIIDIRLATDFTARGRIEGAVNVQLKDLLAHMKTINPASFDRIAIVCYSGQTSGYATAMLRLLGHANVFSVKFGMSAWNSEVANSWNPNIGNNFTNFVTTNFPKPAAGSLPNLNTGKKTGREILEARIDQLLASTDPWADIRITWQTVTPSLSNYFLVNYWPKAHYDLGHLSGAINYIPRSDLKLSAHLKTLPTDRTIVIYCYTGQTSAQTAFILKVLGYDAKSLLFGVNAMNYDWMRTNGLTTWHASEIKNFPFVR